VSARSARIAAFGLCAVLGAALLVGSMAQGAARQKTDRFAYSLELTGTIDPATSGWVDKALGEAADEDAEIAVIRLDTPGGLDDSLREIVKDILAAPMPVIVYVSPDGARAASAGVFVTEAADVAAMAPQTNIGSASPITIGPGSNDKVLGRKIRNDAAAYVRALAAAHGRNATLAARMVTRAANVTAPEARAAGLIDVVANSERELLQRIDGFRVSGPKAQVLHTAGLRIEHHDMPLQYELLQIIVNPTVAFLLLTVGLIGLAIELFSPGLIAPGALGLISFVLGLYGTAQLPVTVAGVLLLIAAIGLMVAEAHLATHGVLGLLGVVALVLSGLLLFNSEGGAEVSAPVVVIAGLVVGGLFALAIERAVRARREPVHTGYEELVGRSAEVRTPLEPEGQVWIEGALWRARLEDGDGRVAAGDRVRVESVQGLTLHVRPESGRQREGEQSKWQ
jgi:membrane-bound serine protease (ClpP class)